MECLREGNIAIVDSVHSAMGEILQKLVEMKKEEEFVEKISGVLVLFFIKLYIPNLLSYPYLTLS